MHYNLCKLCHKPVCDVKMNALSSHFQFMVMIYTFWEIYDKVGRKVGFDQ